MGFFGQIMQPFPHFPAATSERFYLPKALAYATIVPTRYHIAYIPYFVKKATSNLQLCVEQTVANNQTIEVGIYDASQGLPSASRLYSGTISTTGAAIYSHSSNFSVSAGYYIVAGMATSATPLQCRTITLNALTGDDFGRNTADASISTSYFFTQTDQTSLPSQVGTVVMSATNSGVNVFLRY